MLRCSKIQKNLSAFLDNELNTEERKQIEQHLSECVECRQEMEKLRHTIYLVSKIECPEVPSYLWQETREILTRPVETGFRIPKWSFIPVGALVFTSLMYLLVSQSFFIKHENGQIPVAIYLQEHKSVYSEQSSLIDSWVETVSTNTNESTKKSQSNTSASELDILMEAHYGGPQTDGS